MDSGILLPLSSTTKKIEFIFVVEFRFTEILILPCSFPNAEVVTIEKNIDDIELDVKRLQTLGIIINELLTNIMKYAFNGKTNGIISISVNLNSRTNVNSIFLVVEDNGNSIPESIDFQNSTGFGLMLVGLLTKQLKGNIRIERENGTRVILEFEM